MASTRRNKTPPKSDDNAKKKPRSMRGFFVIPLKPHQAFLVRGRKIANTPNSGRNEHRKYTYSIP